VHLPTGHLSLHILRQEDGFDERITTHIAQIGKTKNHEHYLKNTGETPLQLVCL
jgi:hypothetical protein